MIPCLAGNHYVQRVSIIEAAVYNTWEEESSSIESRASEGDRVNLTKILSDTFQIQSKFYTHLNLRKMQSDKNCDFIKEWIFGDM